MSRRPTKKSVIREYLERQHPKSIGKAEAAAIREEIARVLGAQARISDDYLLGVLDEMGARVERELRGISPEVYAHLHFGSLEAAEASLRNLDEHYRSGLSGEDKIGAEDCRRAALLARRRSERIARNTRVSPAKRAEKEEIARWFTIWLQTPDVFFDWLDLRKNTEEFRRLLE